MHERYQTNLIGAFSVGRDSAFFYRYRRDVLGMDEARARADMEEVWQPKGVWAEFVKR